MRKFTPFLIFIACIIGWIAYGSHGSPADTLSHQRINKTGKRLEKKYNMSISAIGGASKGGIWLIDVGFDRLGDPMTIEEGRRAIVDCVQEYLKDINTDEALRPYLKVYPFTIDNLHIAIFHGAKDGGLVFDPILELIAADEFGVVYKTRDPDNIYKYKNIYKETYEEALAILQKEKENSN